MTRLPALEVPATGFRDLEAALGLEWLVTDGTGSYASSTVPGCNTRRYHGLLVAARRPPGDRAVLLSRVEDELTVDGERIELATSEYPGAFHPAGWRHLVRFRLDPFPAATFAAGGVSVTREVFPLRGRRAMAVRWLLAGSAPRAEIAIRPVVAGRSFHHLARPDAGFSQVPCGRPGDVGIAGREGLAELVLRLQTGTFEPSGLRFHRQQYRVERERGLDFEEDLWSPGRFVAVLERGVPLVLVAAAGEPGEVDPEAERTRELERRAALVRAAPHLDPRLVLAADDFVVRRGDAGWILAGFHWFDAWGRDTFVSLEGLTLATRRWGDARAILETWAGRVTGGILPNFLAPDPTADATNSIDAGLWFVHAIGRYLSVTGDEVGVLTRLWPAARGILDAYREGTRHGIRAGRDGLLAGGTPDEQLTWMDAVADGRPVTPRHGKPIEVQALWRRANQVGADLARRAGADPGPYAGAADRVAASFPDAYRLAGRPWLADVPGSDEALRPNQVLALALAGDLVDEATRWRATGAVRRRLLTPWGLRTLAPDSLGYVGRCAGSPSERDRAYHQGTAWPWLLGAYGELVGRDELAELLSPWPSHLLEGCVGQVAEIFDGEAPHRPRGAVAQAWSVAELLRSQERLGR